MPTEVTTSWWKEQRGAKVFVDYNQANRDRTMAGAYSARPLAMAPVSTPLEWSERDLGNGVGELPFPPDFPKMPGEPPRVQPSRAKKS